MKIKRQYLKNRHREYNGKIKYSLSHQGEEQTRTSRNEYLHAAIIDINRPETKWIGDQPTTEKVQYTKVIWSSKPIPESRALNEIGYRKKDMAERIKKARIAEYFKITYYQVDLRSNAKHKAWKLEWSDIEQLSKRDIEKEIKEIKSPTEAIKLIADVKKRANIPDDKRGSLIEQAKLTGIKINYFRMIRMTIEERRCPQQIVMREFMT